MEKKKRQSWKKEHTSLTNKKKTDLKTEGQKENWENSKNCQSFGNDHNNHKKIMPFRPAQSCVKLNKSR